MLKNIHLKSNGQSYNEELKKNNKIILLCNSSRAVARILDIRMNTCIR